MTLGFPTNTILAIVAAMIGTGAGIWFNLAAGLRQLAMAPGVAQRWRWGIGTILVTEYARPPIGNLSSRTLIAK
jgi:hypothetical protein